MAKRGRPRKERPLYDFGTPELLAKRLAIAPSDPSRASNPLDALLAREVISQEAHGAAVHFLACRALVFGNPHPQANDPNRVTGPVAMLENEGAESSYREACAMLKRRGSKF